jgi:hypothetical protein
LRQPLRAGPVTPDLRRDFDTRLQGARRVQAERDGRTLERELGRVIDELAGPSGAQVIDIAAAQVTVTTASLDEAGSPQVRAGGEMTWTSLLPGLAAAEPERLDQLADGAEGLSPDHAAELLRDRLPGPAGDRVLVICRPEGWRILEGVAAALGAGPRIRSLRLSGAASLGPGQRLAELAATAPLSQPYWLATAKVDSQTGAVVLRRRQLFAAGAQPGAEALLALRRMPGDMTDTTLAIFAESGAAPARPLAMYSAPAQPAAAAARLLVVLDGPGRMRVVEPAGAVPHPGTWAQVSDHIPARVSTAAEAADLVCAIDLAGTLDVVRQRTRLVRELLELLGAEYPARGRLRVGLVTCTDHVFGRRPEGEDDPVTSVLALGPAAGALAWLGGQTGADIRNEACAPVEDLLDDAARLLAGSRRSGRSPRLLTVAGRLPHPYPERGDRRLLPCPRKLTWEQLMDQLVRRAGARCAVISDASPGGARREQWRQLGPAGLRALAGATARLAAEDLGLLAGRAQRIPLPLADEPDGAIR